MTRLMYVLDFNGRLKRAGKSSFSGSDKIWSWELGLPLTPMLNVSIIIKIVPLILDFINFRNISFKIEVNFSLFSVSTDNHLRNTEEFNEDQSQRW